MASRLGPRTIVIAGILIMAGALFHMGRFDLSMGSRPIEITGFFLGLGQALVFNPLAVLSYSTLDVRHRTEGAVFSTMFRTVAGSIGIGLMQAGLTRQNAVSHEALSAKLSTVDPVIGWSLPNALSGGAGALESLNAEITRQGSMIAYDSLFAWMSLGTLALLPLILLLKPVKGPAPMLREAHAD